jgi:drug/metabolite transporter (DMT)-like permease
MLWFPLSFCAAVFWAVGHVFLKKGFDHVSPLWNNILDKLVSLLLWIPVVLFLSGFSITPPPPAVVGIIILASGLYLFFFYAISRGQISLTGTIVAGYPLFTVLLSYFFLGEKLTALQYLGIALILTGDIVVALPDGGKKLKGARGEHLWILWGFIGAAALGVGDFLTKVSINRIGAYSHIFWMALISNAVVGCNYLVDRRNRPAPPLFQRRALPSLVGIVINLAGALLFLLAFDYGKVSLIAPVSSTYPALMALFAVKFLHESVSLKQGAGIAVAIIGLVLVGMGTF